MLNVAIIRLQSGEKAAFRPLIEATQADVRTWIAYHGIGLTDVDDIAQATFIHVYEHIGQFEVGTDFHAWIRTIAYYKTKAFLEKRSRELRNRGRLLESYLLEKTPDIVNPRDSSEMASRLRKCLQKLGDRGRHLIQLRYSGVPLRKIAEDLDRSVPAVKMMLMRMRLQLRRCVETQL
ncbi:sigma-70 family RNA polymerase sigma factor [Planctomycetota bacterium]